ncbi:MAG: hypothetical protein KA998_00590 [Rickettsiaceae bacterium]|nr:hypothetical protein [Rickettsiaceae bacterium]
MRNILVKTLLYSTILILSIFPSSLIRVGISSEILPIPELLFLYFLIINYDLYAIQIFLYGIFIDESTGLPLGLTSSLLIISYYIIYKLKPHILSKGRMLEILTFFPICVIYSIAKYCIIKLCLSTDLDIIKITLQSLITILFYPSIKFLLGKILEMTDQNAK